MLRNYYFTLYQEARNTCNYQSYFIQKYIIKNSYFLKLYNIIQLLYNYFWREYIINNLILKAHLSFDYIILYSTFNIIIVKAINT